MDDLFFHDIKVEEMYPELAVIMKIIFTLSHPQTNVERGFNDNNVVLKQNQKHETVVSRRFLKNYMTPNNLLLHTLPVTQKLVKPFKSSWRRHRQHLEDKKKKEEKKVKNQSYEKLVKEIGR